MALEYHTQSLRLFEQSGNQDGLVKILENISLTYEQMGNEKQAERYRQRAKEISDNGEG